MTDFFILVPDRRRRGCQRNRFLCADSASSRSRPLTRSSTPKKRRPKRTTPTPLKKGRKQLRYRRVRQSAEIGPSSSSSASKTFYAAIASQRAQTPFFLSRRFARASFFYPTIGAKSPVLISSRSLATGQLASRCPFRFWRFRLLQTARLFDAFVCRKIRSFFFAPPVNVSRSFFGGAR